MFRKKILLLVEDDEEAIKLIKTILKKTNVKIFVSKTGEDAIDIVKKHKIDIALMDYKLPYKNGILITKEIKEIDKNIPIILETVEKMLSENLDIVKDFQFDDVIAKPYEKDKFIETIKKYIDIDDNGTGRRIWQTALATVLFTLLSISVFFFIKYEKSDNRIYEKYYTYNVIDVQRGGENDDAISKFKEMDYDRASILFQQIMTRDTNNVASAFYYGITNMELEKYDTSIEVFNKIIEHGDNPYDEYSKWYLALCHLKINKRDEAIKEFKMISIDEDNFYNEKAKDILEELN